MLRNKLIHFKFMWLGIKKSFTFRKFFNSLINWYEYRTGKIILVSHPRQTTIETINYCNLRCPACPTITPFSKRKREKMSFNNFKKIIENEGKYFLMAAINPSGEAFLNDDIWKMITTLNKHKIYTHLESNFNLLKPEEAIKNIINSKLDFLSVSIDGATPEVYKQYRVGGDFNKVMANLKKLTDLKEKIKTAKPYIKWQFIAMKHNEHEINKARDIADKLGIDDFGTFLPFAPVAEYYMFNENQKMVHDINKKFSPKNKSQKVNSAKDLMSCYQAYKELVINVDGSIIPCCRLRGKGISFGNAFSDNIFEVWNNKSFQQFRKNLQLMGNNKNCQKCCNDMKIFMNNNK